MKKEFDFTKKWAEHIKKNPDWRKQHNNFINAQIIKANTQLKRLSKEKLKKLFNIKNEKVLKSFS